MSQEISLDAPPLEHPLIDDGTVANVLLPVLRGLPKGGSLPLATSSITIPWSFGLGRGRSQVTLRGQLRVGEIFSADPNARTFRLETVCQSQQLVFCVAGGRAWPIHLDKP